MSIEGQMTIFDFLQPESDLPELEEIIQLVKDKYNLAFNKKTDIFRNAKHEWYYCKKNGIEITLENGKFWDSRRYVSVDINYHDGGSAWPCEDLTEIYSQVEKGIEMMKAAKEKV